MSGAYLVGQAPEKLGAPLPPGAEVVGAMGQAGYWTVFLDSPKSPAEVIAFYRTQPGWEVVEPERHQSANGFLSESLEGVDSGSLTIIFRQEPPTLLQITAHRLAEGQATQVMLSVQTGKDAHQMKENLSSYSSAESLLPVLRAPSGVQVRPTGGGGSNDWYNSEANLQISQSLKQLHQAYAEQLRTQGWAEVNPSSTLPGGGEASLWHIAAENEQPVRLVLLDLQPVPEGTGLYRGKLTVWTR